ncbi:hypothetical protein SUGI_1196400 [Cryptomeria japonica]|uniref:disease resistance protein RPS2 n=1 Tax=Cryptomeria japonica TaxID=3369 RepID=UPI00241493C3|nr:disease resistance protein RPS2 [Cryptomeria japonica]GLJ55694.1 hypothetical protein SUGI_1196400 [Cryptomeria japonica]
MAEMAVSMFVEPVVKILLNEVIEQGSKFKDKARSLLHFNRDMVRLSSELKDLSVVLEDAMPDYQRLETSPYAEDPKYWKFIKELYKVVQDAEDVIQDCQYVKKGCRRLLLPIQVSRRLKDIQQRITSLKRVPFPRIEIRDECTAVQLCTTGLNLCMSSNGITVSSQLQTTPEQIRGATLRLTSMRRDSMKRRLQPVDGIPLGLNDQISHVQKMLIEDEETYIFGINGIGGSGKSLLMKCVWNSDEVQKSFENDLLIWMSIYPNQIAGSQRTLARHISMEFNNSWNQQEAKAKIYSYLVRKRFLMVVEDLWPNDNGSFLWDVGVPKSKEDGSKIVVISRYKEDLTKIKPDMPLIYSDPLSEKDSWRLFESYAFGSTGSPVRPEVMQNARKIATRCHGHPLALKAYGAAMAAKRDPSDWPMPSEEGETDQDENLFRKCSPAEREIFKCLRSSYESLPLHLRLAFLYFAAFPEGLVVRTADIIDLWTAERLIPAYSPSQADLYGRRMLKTLMERCVVEGVEAGSLGVVRKCKMHPMFRLLACHILRRQNEEDEDGEGTSLFRAGDNLTEFPSHEIRHQRRISLMYNHISSLPRKFRCRKLRTLILRHSEDLTVIPRSFFKSLKWLRTLDLSMTGIESLPNTISCLERLENLNLSRTRLKSLPVAITGLHRLKKLNLFECKQLERLPLDMNKLEHLRYLNLRRCTKLKFLPYQVTQICSLQCLIMDGCQSLQWKTLHQKSAVPNNLQYSRLEDLKSLRHLKYLSFVCESVTRIPNGLMGHFESLQRLEICAVQLGSLPEEIQHMKILQDLRISRLEALVKIPQWLCNMESLRRITLEYLKVKAIPPSVFETLPLLRLLEIEHCEELTDLPAEFCKERSFPALEELRLDHLRELKELPCFAQGTMTMLKELRVRYCKKITRFPKGVEKLKKNTKIDIAGSVGLIDSVGDNGIDRERMRVFRANLSY